MTSLSPSFARLSEKQNTAQVSGGGVMPGPPTTIERRSAGSEGTLLNWTPKRITAAKLGRSREKIVERAIDLDQNDPHVSGLIEGMNLNVVGTGFTALAKIKRDLVPIDEKLITKLQNQQEWEWHLWGRNCDIHGRKHFQDILLLQDRIMLVRGEYLMLVRRQPGHRHSFKLQVVDPLRMKTPSDKMNNDRIIDGVEIDGQGAPIAVWIHNNPRRPYALQSSNFKRIPIRRGHQLQVLHGFIEKEPDQYRGGVFFAPAMKFFNDLSDLLDSEVVSNIVASAISMVITSPDPTAAANAASGGSAFQRSGSDRKDIEETEPGGVYYTRPGEEPKLMAALRPGDNFVPFIDTVLRAAASCAGIPLEVATKRYGDMTYSSARAALLEAWRVFGHRQDWHGRRTVTPCWEILQEENHLRGYIDMPDFYTYREAYTNVGWIKPSRGQLEPVKETQANILKRKHFMKTQSQIASEEGYDWETDIAEQAGREAEIARLHGLEYPDTNKGAAKENAK